MKWKKCLMNILQFTSSSYLEKDELFNLSELIMNIFKKYNNKNIHKDLLKSLFKWKKKFN